MYCEHTQRHSMKSSDMHSWCSGNIGSSHPYESGLAPGSTPGGCTAFFPTYTTLTLPKFHYCHFIIDTGNCSGTCGVTSRTSPRNSQYLLCSITKHHTMYKIVMIDVNNRHAILSGITSLRILLDRRRVQVSPLLAVLRRASQLASSHLTSFGVQRLGSGRAPWAIH